MPLTDLQQYAPGLPAATVPQALPQEPDSPDASPSAGEVWGAAFRQGWLPSTVYDRYIAHPAPDVKPVPGYDPLQDVPAGYEQYADRFLESDSPAHTQYIKQRIDAEQKDRETIAHGGAGGFVASLAAGVVDPLTLASMAIPVGGELAWGARAARLAAIGAGTTAAQEAVQHTLLYTKTPGESLENILGGTIGPPLLDPLFHLGGRLLRAGGRAVLPGIFGPIGARVPREVFDQVADHLGEELHNPDHTGPSVLGEPGPSVLHDLPSDVMPAPGERVEPTVPTPGHVPAIEPERMSLFEAAAVTKAEGATKRGINVDEAARELGVDREQLMNLRFGNQRPFTTGGASLEEMGRELGQHGYVSDHQDLVDALQAELGGEKQYSTMRGEEPPPAPEFEELPESFYEGPLSSRREGEPPPKGMSAEDVARVAQLAAAGHEAMPPLMVHQDTTTLPQHIQDVIARDQAEHTTGAVYDPKTGTMHLIAENNASPAEVRENLWHEAVGHHGLRMILNPEDHARIMDGIWRDMPEQVRAAAVRNGLDVGDLGQRRIAAEEVVAYAAGKILEGKPLEGTERTLWQKVVAAIQAFFRRLGGGEHWDEKAIARLVQRSAEAVRHAPASVEGVTHERTSDVNDSHVFKLGDKGALNAEVEGGLLKVRNSLVRPDLQGQGLGKKLYAAAIQYARERGLGFASDRSVSPQAEQVWESLRRQGYNVQQSPQSRRDSRGHIASLGPAFSISAEDLRGGGALRSQRAAPWFSPVEHAVATSTQGKASGEQWLATLKKTAGVKPEELEWLNLEGWLKGQKSVTREQLADYLRANRLELQESSKGGFSPVGSLLDLITERMEQVGNNSQLYDGLRIAKNLVAQGDRRALMSTLDMLAETERNNWRTKGKDPIASEIRAAAEKADLEAEPPALAMHEEHQLPGAEPGSYRELLLRLPPDPQFAEREALMDKVAGGDATPEEEARLYELSSQLAGKSNPDYTHGHWAEPNILGWARLNDRVDTEGKRTLFLEELQSDWHQGGRARGYSPEENAAIVKDLETKLAAAEIESANAGEAEYRAAVKRESKLRGKLADAKMGPVPEAPYKTTWSQMLMRRMIRYAAEHGHERIAWTPGDIQNARWAREGSPEGFRGFYDKILTAETNKTIKRFGAKVGKAEIPVALEGSNWPPGQEPREAVHSFDVTPQMREAALSEGMPLFARRAAPPPGPPPPGWPSAAAGPPPGHPAAPRGPGAPRPPRRGFASPAPSPRGEQIAVGGRGIAASVGKLAPSIRIMRSASQVARRLLQDLANLPEELSKNARGIATGRPVEREIWKIPGLIHDAQQEVERHYRAYRQRVGRGQAMPRREFGEAVGDAMSNNDVHAVREVRDAALATRNGIFQEGTRRAQATGALPPQLQPPVGAPSYYARIYNIPLIKRLQADWRNLLIRGFTDQGVSRGDAGDIAHRTTQVILHTENDPETFQLLNQALASGHFQGRTLNLPDNLLRPFLHKDVYYVIDQWARSVFPEIMFREKFGNADLAAQLGDVSADYQRMIEAAQARGDAAGVRRLQQGLEDDLRDFQAMRDRLFGTYARAANDPNSPLVQGMRNLRSVGVLRQLGSAALSHITDIGNTMLRFGAVNTTRAWLGLALNPLVLGQLRQVAMHEAQRMGAALDTAHNIIASIGGDYGHTPHGPVGRVLSGLTQGWGIPGTNIRIPGFTTLSLETAMIDRVQMAAATLAQDEIMRSAQAVAAGRTLPSSRIRTLASAGIDAPMLRRIAAQLPNMQRVGGFRFGMSARWADQEAARAFESAVVRDAHAMTLRPGVGDMPLFMSNEMARTVLQFTSFAFAARAIQSRIGQGLAHGDAAAISGLFGLIGLGYLTYALKQGVSGMPVEDFQEHPERVALEVADKTNVLGPASRALPLLWQFGNRDLSRWSDSDPVETLLGPSAGMVTDLYKRQLPARIERGLGMDVQAPPFDRRDLHFIRKLLPGQNLWYSRYLLNQMEDYVAGSMDLPGLSQAQIGEMKESVGAH